MPTYDYECTGCGHRFEKFLSMSHKAAVRCPSCRSSRATRRIAVPGFILKGSGFYANDSKGSGAGRTEPDPACEKKGKD
jgi:putative FmdB family regulatory protein